MRWSRMSIIDGYGNRVVFKCVGCEEPIPINEWVFKRDEAGVGEYSCPKCGKVWGRG
jgi:formate dehydrogenase maturation protein FdhE